MKKNYIQPSSIVLQMGTAPMMAALSGKLSDDTYTGTAGAKGDVDLVLEFEEDNDGNTNTSIVATRKYFNLWED